MNNKLNTFDDDIKVATITNINFTNKTVDIRYDSQSGSYVGLYLPYNFVGLTWGLLAMPKKFDKVLVKTANGGRPTIIGMYQQNTAMLPFLDGGELCLLSSGGSYVQLKNQRKRSISKNELLTYDAPPSNDIQLEPSGVVLRSRTQKNIDQNAPRFSNHSYLSLFEGDIHLQSEVDSLSKGFLHLNNSGLVMLAAAQNATPTEYIELDPLNHNLLLYSSKEIHSFAQTNNKSAIYNNSFQYIGGSLNIKAGIDLSQIPADFNQWTSSTGIGDYSFDNSSTQGTGNYTLDIKNDIKITTNLGSLTISIDQGQMNVTAKGNVSISTQGTTTVNSTGDIDLNTSGNANLNIQGNFNAACTGAFNVNASSMSFNANGHINFNKDGNPIITAETFANHTHHYENFGEQTTSTPINPVPDEGLYG